MKYTIPDLILHSQTPVDFCLWMNVEDFLSFPSKLCSVCNSPTTLQESTHFQNDGVCLRCANRGCLHYFSVREDTWFAKSHLSLKQQMELLICFVAQTSATATAQSLGMARQTVMRYFDRCRYAYESVLKSAPIEFSDTGEYELDETAYKRVLNNQNKVLPLIWICGILHRETGRVFLWRVEKRSGKYMLPPIRDKIPQGAFLYSDEYVVYHKLDDEYLHYAVNHSKKEYERDEPWGEYTLHVHINTMEGLWGELRHKMKFRANRNFPRIDLILAETMYRHSGQDLFAPFKVWNNK